MLTALLLAFVSSALWIAALVVAGVVTWRGLRGRLVDDHPHCAACLYDLVGGDTGSDRCPECGVSLVGVARVRAGRRQPNLHRACGGAFAAALLVIGPPALVELPGRLAPPVAAPPAAAPPRQLPPSRVARGTPLPIVTATVPAPAVVAAPATVPPGPELDGWTGAMPFAHLDAPEDPALADEMPWASWSSALAPSPTEPDPGAPLEPALLGPTALPEFTMRGHDVPDVWSLGPAPWSPPRSVAAPDPFLPQVPLGWRVERQPMDARSVPAGPHAAPVRVR